ncbi:MAG: carbonic anhydrase [Actinomycetota bacterium]
MERLSAPELLERVLAGNARWAAGDTERDLLGAPADPLEHLPPVAVIGCSDARVPPAAVLGAAAGAIFTVRLPGQYVDIPVASALGFAMTALDTRLAIVLAHEDCRAVHAAYEEYTTGEPPNLALAPLTGALAAGLYRAGGATGADEAIDVNARVTAQALITECPSLRKSIIEGDAQLCVLRYSPRTRLVTVLEERVVPHAGVL